MAAGEGDNMSEGAEPTDAGEQAGKDEEATATTVPSHSDQENKNLFKYAMDLDTKEVLTEAAGTSKPQPVHAAAIAPAADSASEEQAEDDAATLSPAEKEVVAERAVDDDDRDDVQGVEDATGAEASVADAMDTAGIFSKAPAEHAV